MTPRPHRAPGRARPALLLCALALACALPGCGGGPELNDVHSRLNPTRVDSVHQPGSTEEVVALVRRAKAAGKAVSISGSRHAMGGQQFGAGTLHISMQRMNDILALDPERGIVTVEAGIEWPELVDGLLALQEGADPVWTIVQKQTGADRLSLGGALSANAHGRGATFQPIVQDVESFTLVDADGEVLEVSRTQHPELFRLVIGGYGLFGVIATVDLRLMRRTKLERVVEVVSLEELPGKAAGRLRDGFLYGDFQYKTDGAAEDFMQLGVLSAYRPVPADTPMPEGQRRLARDDWYRLMGLAHSDKTAAFDLYARYYLGTDGQVYWSDLHQMSEYLDDYVEFLAEAQPELPRGSLMITEVYVPRDQVGAFVQRVVADHRHDPFDVIYGTLRLIEQDDQTFLAWAKQDYVCIIFNLRVVWSEDGMGKAEGDFRRLIDHALALDGSYFLTYHRWARKDQVLAAYPQFVDFLRLKLRYDPEERFQSEWYRHYRSLFEAELAAR